MEKRKTLFLLCGVPGCGKTTLAKNYLEESTLNCVHVSRDEVRFSMLNDEDEYFAKETAVFHEFIKRIKDAINNAFVDVIFVDATHLNERSRNKTLRNLDLSNVDIYPINWNVSLDYCLEHNALRTGRAFVPPEVVRNRYESFEPATENEQFKYKHVLTVTERGEE